MKNLSLNVFGIIITWNGVDRRGASITSDMKETDTLDNTAFNTGVDVIESMVLAHFCAGMNVNDPAYLEGIEMAYLSLGNNTEVSPNKGSILPSIDGDYYQWLKPTETGDGLRFLHIEGDEINLSTLMFSTPEEAIQAIKEEAWGWSSEDAEDFVLVRVSKMLTVNPFNSNINTSLIPSEPNKKLQFAVYVEGGRVDSVFCKNTKGFDCEFSIYEYDVDNLDEEDITLITQPDGKKAEAYVYHQGITDSPAIDLNEVFKS